MNVHQLARDSLKGLRDCFLQMWARLYHIRRSRGDSIALDARLDVRAGLFRAARHTIILAEGAEIESRCVLNVYNGEIRIGKGSGVGIGSILIGPIEIGSGAAVAQDCFISGANHRYDDVDRTIPSQGMKLAKVVIGDRVWIGARCVILPGVEIGSNSVVGAGSVVTRSIPARCVAVGNPARIVKRYDAATALWQRSQ
ncbi:MAG TPA: acyltransferase [Verrucomicrobiota bacterium]|nr:acyltransferase [Verrucomicrobiota bacterium]